MLRQISLAIVGLVVGSILTLGGFWAYFAGNPTLNLAGFFYGVPLLLGGLALKASELTPVPFTTPTTPEVLALREQQATPTQNQLRKDVPRYRYGQEAHLDDALKRLGLAPTDEERPLLKGLQDLNQKKPNPKPILLKIAPDLTDTQLDDILDIVAETELAGLVATNTTISRADLKTGPLSIEAIGMGGLSGKPLTGRSTEVIRYLRKNGAPHLVIIGVGGIHSAADASEKLAAGADLVQVYTGLVYEGPTLVRQINEGLLSDLTNF